MSRSDRPIPPRVRASLDTIDMPELGSGDLGDGVSVTGEPPSHLVGALQLSGGLIHDVSFVGRSLVGSRLVDVVMRRCDLSGADLEGAAFTRAEFIECRLSGARLPHTRMRDVRFIECRIDQVNLRSAQAEFVRFERCRLENAEMVGARLTGAAFWDCDLSNADVSQVSVERVQLHGSALTGLGGATSLVPISIDAEQPPAFAALLLAKLGVEVTERSDAEPR
jgi:Pentapeptide repeats (9 copies)